MQVLNGNFDTYDRVAAKTYMRKLLQILNWKDVEENNKEINA